MLTNIIIGTAFLLALLWFFTEGGFEPLITSLLILAMAIGLLIANRKNIKVGRRSIKINSKDPLAKNWRHLRYSFTREEFINPLIVSELQGNLADTGHSVTSIDLVEANQSNRFFCELNIEMQDGSKIVAAVEGEERFAYSYVGTSKSGIHIVHTSYSGGGSGNFHNILLLTISSRNGIVFDEGKLGEKERVVLSIIGCIPLGDRYCGDVNFDGKYLVVEPDTSPLPEHIWTRRLKIRVQ